MFCQILLLLSTALLAFALPSNNVLPQDEPPHTSRYCGSEDSFASIAKTCSGLSQQSVLFTTSREVSDATLSLIGDAVQASGGSVTQRFRMAGFKGLTINAPAKVLDLVEAFGAPYGLKMEGNCKATIQPWVAKPGGPRTGSTGGPGIAMNPGYH